jgi:cation-transporting ATPase E
MSILQLLGSNARISGGSIKLDGKELTENATPIAFILLNNAIREGAMDTFRYFSKRGVEVKVISGDNPVTVSEIAKKAGIRHAEKQVDAATLKTAEAVRKAAKKYTVFGRVTPEQKRLLVQALKEQGKTVAMTGDGVNDILALKDADCSIAMASGSEAASHVAQLVLLDNDFNKMPAVVMEGRRVVNNIGRTASLYLVKNIFSMLLAVFSMLFLIDYPLEPSQVSLISVFKGFIAFLFLVFCNSFFDILHKFDKDNKDCDHDKHRKHAVSHDFQGFHYVFFDCRYCV